MPFDSRGVAGIVRRCRCRYPNASARVPGARLYRTASRIARTSHERVHVHVGRELLVRMHVCDRRGHAEFRVHKLATNGVGPEYMQACFAHHRQTWGDRLPDIVVMEFAVNNWLPSGPKVDMEALVREQVWTAPCWRSAPRPRSRAKASP